MKAELSDKDVDLIVRALDHYYAYTVARKFEDARFRHLAERLKRKPVEKTDSGRLTNRSAERKCR